MYIQTNTDTYIHVGYLRIYKHAYIRPYMQV